MSVKEQLDAAKLRLGAWNRERKERAAGKRAERKAEREADEANAIPGAAPVAWCVFLSMVGVFALAGSTWMLAVFIAGSVGHIDWFSDYIATQGGTERWEWNFSASIHWFNAIGLWLICLAIGVFNAVWIEARKHLHGIFRNWVTGLGLATALFMVAGGVVVQQRSTDARSRDEVVEAQTAQVGAATAAARLERAERRLREMRNHENQYMAVAATVGAAEFERSYLSAEQRARENPDRVRLLERSLGAARQADALEAEIANLQGQVAVAQTGAVEAQAVTVRAEGWMAAPTRWIEDLRKPFTSILGELLATSAFSLALAAWATRRERPGFGAIPEHRFMVPDMRESLGDDKSMSAAAFRASVAPMDAGYHGPLIYDQDGKEQKWVEGYVRVKDGKWIPGHYRYTGGRKKQEIEVTVGGKTFKTEGMEDVSLAVDGGARQATVPTEAKIDSLGQPLVEPVHKGDEQLPAGEYREGETNRNAEQEATEVQELTPEELLATYGGDDSVEVPQQPADDLVPTEGEPVDEPEQQDAVEQADGEDEQDEPDHLDLPNGEGTVTLTPDEQYDDHVRARALLPA